MQYVGTGGIIFWRRLRGDFQDMPKKNVRISPKSKADGPNPKDVIGSKKVSLTKLPAIATAWGAMAMMDGAGKYGPYNFRDKSVQASIYVDAARRHLDCWFEGEECARDSKVHHLGHALACIAILLDTQATGNLIDDRPLLYDEDGNVIDPSWYADFLDKLSGIIKENNASKIEGTNRVHNDPPKRVRGKGKS
jgi:hypothetical protein